MMSKKNKEKTFELNPLPIIYINRETYDKIKYIMQRKEIEVSGFGILSSKNPLIISDFVILEQEGTIGTTELNDNAIANYIDEYIDKGYQPWQLQRCWIHTHPQGVTSPSYTDYNTFSKCFNQGDFAIMIIFVKSGEIICDLHINNPVKVRIPVQLEILPIFQSSWDIELKTYVKEKKIITLPKHHTKIDYKLNSKKITEMTDKELDIYFSEDEDIYSYWKDLYYE